MSETKEMEVYAGKTALDIFKPDGVEVILNHIRTEATDFEPDTSTDKGRKQIASQARRVSTSKVMLDDARKALVADWTNQTRIVNESGKALRDGCDLLRDEIRKPLTDWEAEEEARIIAEQLAEKLENDHGLAIDENDMFNRQKELDRKEAEQAAKEAERVEKENTARIEQERIEREERIRKEAIESAQKATADALQKAEDEKVQALATARFEAEKAEREKEEAVETARKEEQRRLAEMQAEERRVREAEEARQAKAAQNKAHQKAINNTAVECLVMSTGITEDQAKKVVTAIAKGDVAKVSINY